MYEDGSAAGRAARFNVPLLITDHPTVREVDGEVSRSCDQHSRGGLSPGVLASVLGDRPIRVKWAGHPPLDEGPASAPSARLSEERFGLLVHRINIPVGVSPSCHATLIGNNDQCVPRLVQCADGPRRSRNQSYLCGIAEISIVGDQRVVAVEEDGTAHDARLAEL